MQVGTVITPAATAAAAEPIFHRDQIWPPAIIAFGMGLTVAWISLLGYGLVEFIEVAF
jgi:hypothetical protein